MDVSFTPDPSIHATLARGIQPWMIEFTREVAEEAERIAPDGKPDPLGRPKSGPKLRDSIRFFVTGITGHVIANTPYARSVHDGAKPHQIRPQGNYPLRFYWDKAGGVVRAARVNHPGNKPNPFLTKALRTVASRLKVPGNV